jgi:hypothetical protein
VNYQWNFGAPRELYRETREEAIAYVEDMTRPASGR